MILYCSHLNFANLGICLMPYICISVVSHTTDLLRKVV